MHTKLLLSSLLVLGGCSGLFGSEKAPPPAQAQHAVAPPMDSSHSPAFIKQVQTKLQNEGYYVAVDGVWGKATEYALRNYQRDHDMKGTGKLDSETLNLMNLDNTNTNANTPTNDAVEDANRPSNNH